MPQPWRILGGIRGRTRDGRSKKKKKEGNIPEGIVSCSPRLIDDLALSGWAEPTVSPPVTPPLGEGGGGASRAASHVGKNDGKREELPEHPCSGESEGDKRSVWHFPLQLDNYLSRYLWDALEETWWNESPPQHQVYDTGAFPPKIAVVWLLFTFVRVDLLRTWVFPLGFALKRRKEKRLPLWFDVCLHDSD